MTGLNGHDGRSSGQEGRVGQKVGGTEVRGNTDVLDQTGRSSHGGNVRQNAGEVELAAWDDLTAQRVDDRLERASVCCLIALDRCELLRREVGVGETSGGEVGRLELLQRLLVELGLQLLENVRKVENEQVLRVGRRLAGEGQGRHGERGREGK